MKDDKDPFFFSSIEPSGLVENDLPVIYLIYFYSYVPNLSCNWETEVTKTVRIVFRRMKYYCTEFTNSCTKPCM